MERAFRASPGGTIRVQANTAQGAAPLLANFPAGGGCQVRMWNRGTVPVSIEFGAGSGMALPVAAGAFGGSQSISAGAVEVQTVERSQRHVAVFAASGTPDIEFTVGEGL